MKPLTVARGHIFSHDMRIVHGRKTEEIQIKTADGICQIAAPITDEIVSTMREGRRVIVTIEAAPVPTPEEVRGMADALSESVESLRIHLCYDTKTCAVCKILEKAKKYKEARES